MRAIIVHSASKNQRAKKIAMGFEGDRYTIIPNKPINNPILQMIVYGFLTVSKKQVHYQDLSFDASKYDEIVLVSPVWAGQTSAYMRAFLKNNPLKNKNIRLIGTSDGGYKHYFRHLRGLLDQSNDIIEETMYVKGEKINE